MPINLYPDFKFFLAPANKTGKLAFVEVTGPANAPEVGRVLEADFSRPNVGGTSGATVFRNGQLVELEEDEPDWDDADGCAVLKMRPQGQNLEDNAGDPANWYNNSVAPSNEGAFELFPSYYWGKYTQVSAGDNVGLLYSLFSGGENWVISFFVKISESNDYIAIRETGAGVGVIQLSTETVPTSGGGVSSVKIIDTIDNDIKLIIVKGTSQVGGNLFLTLCSSNGSSGVNDGTSFQLTGLQLIEGNEYTGHIPTYGSSVTRSTNQFVFSDLVNKGLVGLTEGTFVVKYNTTIMPRLNSQVYLFFGDSTNGFALGNSTISGDIAIRTYADGVFTQEFRSGGESIILFTYQNGYYKVFVNQNETPEISGTENFILNTPNLTVNGTSIDFFIEKLAFSPTLLTDSQAIAYLNSLL
tara:strand:+ start:23834 stop:25072 length:1239 start_codon:yes stop_codon:yes gene_type:complete